MDVVQQFNPGGGGHRQVQEAFDDVTGGHGGLVGHEVGAYLLGGLLGALAGDAQEGEYHQREVSLKFFLRLLQLHLRGGYLLPVECLQAVYHGLGQSFFYLHEDYVISLGRKDTTKNRDTERMGKDEREEFFLTFAPT